MKFFNRFNSIGELADSIAGFIIMLVIVGAMVILPVALIFYGLAELLFFILFNLGII